jgi:integrase
MSTGIVVRHSRGCVTQTDRDAKCTCKPGPSYRAEVYDSRSKTKLRKTFDNLSEAKGWRHDTASALSKGAMSAPTKQTLRQAWEEFIEAAKAGLVRKVNGETFKPSTLRGYQQTMDDHVLPELGSERLSAIRRRDLQRLVNEMLAAGKDASTIRNTIAPVRVLYRQAVDDIPVNPTARLQLPSSEGRRDRIATPEEAVELIGALQERDRALWATARYAGLRRGELLALRLEDVDLSAGLIRVERSYDPRARQFVGPKSHAGTRKVPIPKVLRGHLSAHKLTLGRSEGLIFGATSERPFTGSNATRRAETAWKRANKIREMEERPLLEPIGLHECRHTFASLMIDAGVNAKALSTYMGHSSITITLDRYGHLFPGNEDEAAALLDKYLEERESAKARLVRVDGNNA